jgi:hypothetical protein
VVWHIWVPFTISNTVVFYIWKFFHMAASKIRAQLRLKWQLCSIRSLFVNVINYIIEQNASFTLGNTYGDFLFIRKCHKEGRPWAGRVV